MAQLGNQMMQTDNELSALWLAVAERREVQDTLQRQLEDYKREHLSVKAAIKEAFEIARQVKQDEV
jgi:septal ring factor EnvC (AmiA/AmiB activator)